MRTWKRVAVWALVLSCVAVSADAKAKKAGAAEMAEAQAAVDAATQQVIAILREDGLSQDQRRTRIEQIAYANFDFETMSKLVLRRDWKRFSGAQKQEFVEQFRLHLSQSYGSRLERYEQQDIAMAGTRPETRGDVTVKTKIVGGQFDGAEVDYRCRKRGDDWLAIDVIIEGVSLVSNFHSQFAGIVGRDGPEGLLSQLREKNASSEIADVPGLEG